jgi:hypothetical protein
MQKFDGARNGEGQPARNVSGYQTGLILSRVFLVCSGHHPDVDYRGLDPSCTVPPGELLAEDDVTPMAAPLQIPPREDKLSPTIPE